MNEQGFTLWDVQVNLVPINNKDLNYFEAKDAFLTLTDFVRHRISEAGKLERRKAREEENEALKVHLVKVKRLHF